MCMVYSKAGTSRPGIAQRAKGEGNCGQFSDRYKVYRICWNIFLFSPTNSAVISGTRVLFIACTVGTDSLLVLLRLVV